MSRIILDQGTPLGLRQFLSGHDVVTAHQMGWSALSNGLLLNSAEAAGFDILITADQNLGYQQNLDGRRIAIVVLTNNHWLTVARRSGRMRAAIEMDTVNRLGEMIVAAD